MTQPSAGFFMGTGFMENTANNEVHVNSRDRALFAIVSAITVALLLWVGATLNSNQIELSKLQVQVSQLGNEARRATADNREVLRRVGELEKDVAALKTKGN